MNQAYEQAKVDAGILRRCGYPNAIPAREYCIDAEIDSDGFYTYTVSVYVGEYDPDTIPDLVRRAAAKGMAK